MTFAPIRGAKAGKTLGSRDIEIIMNDLRPDTTGGPDSGPARILLVDDHHVVRAGLKGLIALHEDLEVVAEAGSAEEAMDKVRIDQPDLVVMDARLPDRSGISACHDITSRYPEVRVLILTSHADDVALAAAVTARASGYVLKSARGSEIVDDLRRVMAGERLFEHGDWGESPPLLSSLSPQERQVATHLGEGLTNREIAARMDLAEKPVKNYVSNVLTKLGMERRSEAAAFVARVEAMTRSTLDDEVTSDTRTGPRERRHP
jgi:two-component system, NarL family, response regulator DevR